MNAQLIAGSVVKNRDVRENSVHSFEQDRSLLIIGTDDDLMILLPFWSLETLSVPDPAVCLPTTTDIHQI